VSLPDRDGTTMERGSAREGEGKGLLPSEIFTEKKRDLGAMLPISGREGTFGGESRRRYRNQDKTV